MFGDGKTREQKQAEQLQKFMTKYNLEELSPKDLITVKKIANDLFSNGFAKAAMALSFSKIEDQTKVTYLSALVEQNWMIINQLSRLNTSMEKLIGKSE